jgi:hypothetical protein
VRLHGNALLERFVRRANKFALRSEKYVRRAQQLFAKEFFEQGYDKILLSSSERAAANARRTASQVPEHLDTETAKFLAE